MHNEVWARHKKNACHVVLWRRERKLKKIVATKQPRELYLNHNRPATLYSRLFDFSSLCIRLARESRARIINMEEESERWDEENTSKQISTVLIESAFN